MPDNTIDPSTLDIGSLWNQIDQALQTSRSTVLELLNGNEGGKLEGEARKRAQHYLLAENDRHEMIQHAAEVTIKEISAFNEIRINMSTDFGFGGLKLEQDLLAKQLTLLNRDFTQFRGPIEATNLDEITQALPLLDPADRAIFGYFYRDVAVASNLVDFANAFQHLHDARQDALERYVNGKLPRNWRRRLPKEVQSILTESGYSAIEHLLNAAEIGFAPIPFGSAFVILTRQAIGIRSDRRRRRLRYRRGDVDDLLDLSDQMARINQLGAEQRSSISKALSSI